LTKIIRRLACATLVAVLAACGSAPVGPGFYRVERGDTLSKIARANRTSVQNISRWNNLTDPNAIEVDQVLRVAPPAGTALASSPSSPSSSAPARTGGGTSSADTAPAVSGGAVKPATSISLIWPVQGAVIRGFDGKTSKGIDIGGTPGTQIVAAAAGSVVYAGNGLRGYGNLLIVKHNADYLTAYAHNRVLLVKEGQQVTQGQPIAEMGDSDTNRVMLHFELRYKGSSIDPSRYLPPR
jgi:murein DD-endopeptidase MepM/ murein hydrolase activator NlpD